MKPGARAPTNALIRALARACEDHLVDEKWVVAPSLRTGHQWLETLSRSGRAALNVRLKTVKGVVIALAGPELTARGLRLASAAETQILIDRAWTKSSASGKGYLYTMQSTPGLLRTVARAVADLRLAGVKPGAIGADGFEVAKKARELSAVLREYEKELKAASRVDYAGCLQLAVDRLAADPDALGADTLLLVPDDADLRPAEEDLVARLPEGRMLRLRTDAPGARPTAGALDSELLRFISDPSRAPEPRGDGSLNLFSAAGATSEVREVLRRTLTSGVGLDAVEVVCTDIDTYGCAIYELLATIEMDPDEPANVPATFADGLPVRYSRPGRALAEWLAWTAGDNPQSRLVDMVRQGLLLLPCDDRTHCSQVADRLAAVPVGFGRDRYLACIDDELASIAARAKRPRREEDDEETHDRRLAAAAGRARGLHELRPWLERLLSISEADAPPDRVLECARTFLVEFARASGELDNLARDALRDDVTRMVEAVSTGDGDISTDVGEWLSALAHERRIGGLGPRPGRLHVSSIRSGGHAGRPVTFIVGLDDGRWPGAGAQDPLMLDHEREEVSPRLQTARERNKMARERFARLVSRLRGHVTLSYSARDLVNDRVSFPSPVLVAAYRIASGNHAADQSELLRAIGSPTSLAPEDVAHSLDEREWWLHRLTGAEPVEDAHLSVMGRFEHLRGGDAAAIARATPEFTAYDGAVATGDSRLDPTAPEGPVVSASSLERLGACPRRYFFANVLRVEPPDDVEVDTQRWLDAGTFGSLLHELFRQFMAELLTREEKPGLAAHAALLQEQLDGLTDHYRREVPPPSESVFRSQCAELQRAARIFLIEEEDHCKTSTPYCLETSIGMAREAEGSALDSRTPAKIKLPSGATVRARGRVDRIDYVGKGDGVTYHIWDYKTGSTYRFREPDPFDNGRVVQHALYVAMTQQLLKKKIGSGAIVSQFGYFFPSAGGRGERKTYAPTDLAAGPATMELLCSVAASGAFCPTNDVGDCEYCDYRTVCGDVDLQAARAGGMLENGANESLEPLRRLRGVSVADNGEEEE